MTYSTEEKLLVLLSSVKGMTLNKMNTLLDKYNTADEVFRHVSDDDFPLPNATSEIKKVMDKNVLEEYFNRLEREGITAITHISRDYPKALNFADAPKVLYVKGDVSLLDKGGVSIIGSRHCTPYGMTVAKMLGKTAADGGITVISGGAKGIDSAALEGAIENGGKTVAVLGFGINVVYPKENRELFSLICKNGALVSEYPLDTPPYQSNFPARNRIIAGLCDLLAVVESNVKSGTNSTVTFAQEQGREVACVPGNITSEQSEGTNKLIKEGAKVITKPTDILSFFGATAEKQDKPIVELTPDERPVVEALKKEFELSLDELAQKCNNSPSKASALLTMMELRCIVKKTAGNNYCLDHTKEYR